MWPSYKDYFSRNNKYSLIEIPYLFENWYLAILNKVE